MAITEQERARIEALCAKFRVQLVEVLHQKQTGHPGGSLSVCEILATLFFRQARLDASRPDDPDRDRVVLSKGHAAPMLYICLAEKGFFPDEELGTLRDFETRLQGHPCSLDTPGVELTAGPLGLGLSASLGMALGLRLSGSPARVYAVLGDGEIDEGVVWEGAMSAAKFNPGNLTAILDWNHVQLDGPTDEIMPTGDVAAKFAAFGWNVLPVPDGHDVAALCEAYDAAAREASKPSIVIAHTVKGKGVSFMEGKSAWHGAAIKDQEYEAAMAELQAGLAKAMAAEEAANEAATGAPAQGRGGKGGAA